MIVLDTNVLSELFRPEPDKAVMAWVAGQPATTLFTTAITRGEMMYGVKQLPNGKRREALLRGLSHLFDVHLAGRVLVYDSDAADAYADIVVARRGIGKPISQSDAMICGITRSRGANLATRNVRDFESCGVTIIDPWAKTT